MCPAAPILWRHSLGPCHQQLPKLLSAPQRQSDCLQCRLPSPLPEPKPACVWLAAKEETRLLEFGWTGKESTGRFHAFEAGKTGQLPIVGPADDGTVATRILWRSISKCGKKRGRGRGWFVWDQRLVIEVEWLSRHGHDEWSTPGWPDCMTALSRQNVSHNFMNNAVRR